MDKGNPALNIPAYNGGLFARNAIIDALGLSNFVCENFAKIADYDFSSEVPVSVLGHIFEKSVSDIEKMRAEAQGQPPPKTAKSKREGVVYTPDFVTRFIVEETIGKTLSERFAEVHGAYGVAETITENGKTYDWTPETELKVWRDYRQELRGLTIVDPACGSGAFLIAAFDYFAAEYKRVAERIAALGEVVDASELGPEILAHNLHGVDLNPEPVEITKLALWLKTAKRGKLLQDLEQSIKCGNSLIADKNEHGRAFDWQAEFPAIFAHQDRSQRGFHRQPRETRRIGGARCAVGGIARAFSSRREHQALARRKREPLAAEYPIWLDAETICAHCGNES